MPLPVPKKGESRQDFIGRCMANPVMNREFKDKDQRAAVCYSQWRRKGRTILGGEDPRK